MNNPKEIGLARNEMGAAGSSVDGGHRHSAPPKPVEVVQGVVGGMPMDSGRSPRRRSARATEPPAVMRADR
jgi:hypothetical protein